MFLMTHRQEADVMSRYNFFFMLFAFLVAGTTMAAPAAWFQWRSKLEPVLVCSQTSPGDGWQKSAGPYTDARCEKLKAVHELPQQTPLI